MSTTPVLLFGNPPAFLNTPPPLPAISVHDLTHYLANIFPDVMIEEVHEDHLTITDSPVELSASGDTVVSDNAYKLPAEVTLMYGWSPSGGGWSQGVQAPPDAGTDTLFVPAIGEDVKVGPASNRADTFLNEVYRQLLSLQQARTVFAVKTTRRDYPSMVLSAIQVSTDVNNYYSLVARLTCREIIFAVTMTVQVSFKPITPPVTGGSTTTPIAQQQLGPAPHANQADVDRLFTYSPQNPGVAIAPPQ